MSDLGHLFARRPTGEIFDLEDFTTEALAIAIRHDVSPMRRLLAAVETWQESSGRPGIDPASIVAAEDVHTQVILAPIFGADRATRLRAGRLDLVVGTLTAGGARQVFWFENKVDAAESKDQLDVYLGHRLLSEPPAVVVTLTRTGYLRPDVTSITWDDVAAAVAAEPSPDAWWTDLVAFLREHDAVLPPMPPGPFDPAALVAVFRAVNAKIATLWPEARPTLHWIQVGALERQLTAMLPREHRMWTTGGPLGYGIEPHEGAWRWRITLGTGSRYRRIWVPSDTFLAKARETGFGTGWTMTEHHGAIFERTMPHADAALDAIVAWLLASLDDVARRGMVGPYLAMAST